MNNRELVMKKYTLLFVSLLVSCIMLAQGPANRGIAQAKAVIFFVLVAGIGLIQLRITRRKEVQQ